MGGPDVIHVQVERVDAADDGTIAKVVKLGDRARKTLGFMPPAVYYDAAAKHWLLAAMLHGEPVGYVLFRLPRDEVVLTHVCVHPDFRKSGIAKQLVDQVSDLHSARQGIKAKCRDDYDGIANVWTGLGFTPRARARGRGHDRKSMTIWWRDHEHPNLFTPPMEEPTVVQVAIDTMILLDLLTGSGDTRRARSAALLAQHLIGRMELVVTRGLERDLDNHPQAATARVLEFADSFTRPTELPKRAQALFDAMLTAVKLRVTGFPKTPQDIGDLWHLAEAAAVGAQAFLTWDERLMNIVAPAALSVAAPEVARMRVLDPDHLEIRLDELANTAAYSPLALAGSHFTTARAGSDARQLLQRFLNSTHGETRSQFQALLREAARDSDTYEVVSAPDGTLIACYAINSVGMTLNVPLLRVANHPIAETLTRQLLWRFRLQARRNGATIVQLTDRHLTPITERIAETESYRHGRSGLCAVVVDVIGSGRDVTDTANTISESVGMTAAPLIRTYENAVVASLYERVWWPAKITDSSLPRFVVPIRPRWSADLFGVPSTLTARDSQLALGREHVYYRSGRRSCLQAPGRILWYMSGDKSVGEGQFIGTSLLDSVERDTPEALHRSYGRYGVFTLEHIKSVANADNIAEALLLSDIELFPYPISSSSYTFIRERIPGPRGFQSPTTIQPAMFEAVYRLGAGQDPSPE
ncbi:GNAT family N-acetyltransferase [Nocardia sp. CA-128927]|uniref:GNAT family N-acetyltransferase n=1 Tax=Nocardia sp. CA-128927 TaxID=3239975 RepID=UPI003D974DD6